MAWKDILKIIPLLGAVSTAAAAVPEDEVTRESIEINFENNELTLSEDALTQLRVAQIALLNNSVAEIYTCTGPDETSERFSDNARLMADRLDAVQDLTHQDIINNFETAKENAQYQTNLENSFSPDAQERMDEVTQMYNVTIWPAFEALADKTTAAFNATSQESGPVDVPCLDGAEQGKVVFLLDPSVPKV